MPNVCTFALPAGRGQRTCPLPARAAVGSAPTRSTFAQVTPRVSLPTGSGGQGVPRACPLLPRCVARAGAALGGQQP